MEVTGLLSRGYSVDETWEVNVGGGQSNMALEIDRVKALAIGLGQLI